MSDAADSIRDHFRRTSPEGDDGAGGPPAPPEPAD